jgi:hypothetical protein
VKFKVLDSQWGADDEVFEAGEHEVAKPTAKFLALIAGGEQAGALEVLEETGAERTKIDGATESQEESEKNLAAAMRSGEWHGANYDQFLLDVEAGTRPEVELPDRETYIEERKG